MRLARALALGSAAAMALAIPASANHSWGNYHWPRTSNPVSLKVNTVITSKWTNYVSTAIGQWNQSTVLTLSSKAAGSGTAKPCTAVAGQIRVCAAAYGRKGWLGLATIWANGDHITQATTKLNDSYYTAGSRYDNFGWRSLVACQEIGHDFGLGHVNENFDDPNTGSCMDYTNDPTGTAGTNGNKANTAPNGHDYNQLESMYAHSDSGAAAGSSTDFGERRPGRPAKPGPPREDAGNGPAEWGAARHRDGKGRPDEFVRRSKDGSVVITHVFWAPDARGTEAN